MELYDVMRTTFSARAFTDDGLSDEVLYRILDNARFAANGGNRQGWKVVVVRSLPIRLTPMTATCRVPPLSRVKLGIGWSRGVARDAEQ